MVCTLEFNLTNFWLIRWMYRRERRTRTYLERGTIDCTNIIFGRLRILINEIERSQWAGFCSKKKSWILFPFNY